MVDDTKKPVLQYYELVLNGRDETVLGDLLAPGFQSHFGEYTVDGVGYAAAVHRTLTTFAELKVEVLAQVGEGDLVATRWRATGTVGGRTVRVTAMHFHRIENGRIVEHWEELDPRALASLQ